MFFHTKLGKPSVYGRGIVMVFDQGQLSLSADSEGVISTFVKVKETVGIVPVAALPITKDYAVVCVTRFCINNSQVFINVSGLAIQFIEIGFC